MLAMSHDVRYVKEGSLFLGMTEISLGMTIPPSMLAPLAAKMTPMALRDINLFGKKISPAEALSMQIVDKVESQENLMKEAIAQAKTLSGLGENRIAFEGIKSSLYSQYAKAAENPVPDKFVLKIVGKLKPKI